MNPESAQAAINATKNLARILIAGGVTVYGAANSFFTVEGGQRAIVYNRVVGIKDTVGVI